MDAAILTYIQVGVLVLMGAYLWSALRSPQLGRISVSECKKELEKLQAMRAVSLTKPLAELTRPGQITEIIGQEEGLMCLRAALCGPNPQHVIIYGPPGVGKTAAARVILEEAKKSPFSPFSRDARFVEIDATTARFDERGIADPLIGSVHDPIYQGAGNLGVAGIPQPKPGAVTRAHGGILFIDEIGELHPIQINKLLKVLEDRRVMLESAYYNPDDTNVPTYIREVFEHGLPADFRLVGATTRLPEDIPPAIRSRCMEVFFKPLSAEDIGKIAANACQKAGFKAEKGAIELVQKYASNGREAVNMVQLAAGLAMTEKRDTITVADMEWVINSGQYSPRPERKVHKSPRVGVVNGLAVYGPGMAMLMEVEASCVPCERGEGSLKVTGIIEEEETGTKSKVLRRKSMAMGSVENVLTALRQEFNIRPEQYHIHVNFPGGIPVDGPSAGVAVACAIFSAITETPVDNLAAMTGEVSIRGEVKQVGGLPAKLEAAANAGAKRVFIPRENWQQGFVQFEAKRGIRIIPVDNLSCLFSLAFTGQKAIPA
ncbi:MAG TPA: ATP-dependent protease LonB [Firmicutes bacterium]|nr:ATP-dependent protease LonB [Bacillota bacterium]